MISQINFQSIVEDLEELKRANDSMYQSLLSVQGQGILQQEKMVPKLEVMKAEISHQI